MPLTDSRSAHGSVLGWWPAVSKVAAALMVRASRLLVPSSRAVCWCAMKAAAAEAKLALASGFKSESAASDAMTLITCAHVNARHKCIIRFLSVVCCLQK